MYKYSMALLGPEVRISGFIQQGLFELGRYLA
jgi:hypothetical protein